MENKFLFIYNIPSPYRVEFINEISKHINSKVIFEKESAKHRNKSWLAKDNVEKDNVIYINKNIFKLLRLLIYIYKSETVILGGYSTKLSVILIFFMKIINKKFILNADGGFIKEEIKLKYYIKRSLVKSAKYWLSTGIETNKYLKYYGAQEKDIFIYPFTSVKDEEILELKELQKKNRQKNNEKRKKVLFVGSFNKEKGINKLIEAATFSENLDFLFIGGEPTDEQLELKGNSTNIKFVEHVNKLELKKYYTTSDLFVFPTYSDVWGLVINEAMANGLPIITTDKCIAGIEMVKSEEVGKIISVNTSAEKLAEHINYAISNYEEFNSSKIISIARDYTIEKMAEAHLSILDNITKK